MTNGVVRKVYFLIVIALFVTFFILTILAANSIKTNIKSQEIIDMNIKETATFSEILPESKSVSWDVVYEFTDENGVVYRCSLLRNFKGTITETRDFFALDTIEIYIDGKGNCVYANSNLKPQRAINSTIIFALASTVFAFMIVVPIIVIKKRS